jgi:NAD(P)-dependent dehydrogenase (short-subunit alcohol dehydrogenase family)
MRDFNGKVAVVTGGAGGIGFAIAERFGREGCLIMLADIEKDALTAAVESLRSQGVTAVGHRCDVANHKSVEELERRTIDEFGKVHLLFNNAGVSITGPSWLLSYDDWRWVWDVNVWGVINGVKTFLPGMLAHGEGGHVINTGSLASFFGNGDHAPYSSSKAAVLGMSQSLYSEMKAMMTGIGVSIVCPGMVATKIHQSYRNRPEGDQPWSDREFANPQFVAGSNEFQGRGIPPEDIAESTFEAVRDDKFYVFNGERVPIFLDALLGRAVRAENPIVTTWGEDKRPMEERELQPYMINSEPV